MSAVIFDFDGTIADSFDYVANFLAEEIGAASLSGKQEQSLHRNMSMAAMARKLGFSWWQLPFLLIKGRRKMNSVIKELEPFDGMPTVIRQLHGDGHRLFIVSSNSARNIRAFLRHQELQDYFSHISGGIGLFSKAAALRGLLKRYRLKRVDTIYVGDELRDVQAGQSINLSVIAVGWGFARNTDLAALQPAALAETPRDLLRIIKKL
jgi:phosphoglycolate phosphatase